MSVGTRITVEQYQAMEARGELEPRVELIRGEFVPRFADDPRMPMNPPHANTIIKLTAWSFEFTSRDLVEVAIQCSVGMPAYDSQPDPDVAWLINRDYSERLPTPEDVLLLIEVSDTSIYKDRGPKSELYAEAGIPDYWIADIPGRRIEVRRDPVGLEYRSITFYTPGQDVRPLAFPEIVLPVSRIFPDVAEGR